MHGTNGIGGATAVRGVGKRFLTALLAFLLGAALVAVTANSAHATTTSGSENLKPGWDLFPDGSGTVDWLSPSPGILEITYEVNHDAEATLDVGLIQTDIEDGTMLTEVVDGSFDFKGLLIGPFTREDQNVGPYNAWVFGEEFTTGGEGHTGSVTVTLNANPGTWDVQFIVLPDGTTTPNYESTGVFGTTVEVTVLDEVPNTPPAVTVDEPTTGETFGTGDTVDVTANFTDDGSEGYDCTIDWGDDSTSEGDVTSPDGESPGTCSGSHQYSGPGLHTITVTITDDEEASGDDSVQIEIVDDVIQCGDEGNPCDTFEDPNGNWQASCEDCGDATLIVRDTDQVADIEITGSTPEDGFTLELISNDRPFRWWRTAGVDVIVDGVPEPLDRCTFRERLQWAFRQERPDEGCFYLTPLFHDRLKYTVLWPDDPRFAFK